MDAKTGKAARRGSDGKAQRRKTAWPLDVMKSAASMIVDHGINARDVSRKLNIPYTTVGEWGRKYRSGGEAALLPRAQPGRVGAGAHAPDFETGSHPAAWNE